MPPVGECHKTRIMQNIIYFISFIIWPYVDVCILQCVCGSQETSLQTHFSPSTFLWCFSFCYCDKITKCNLRKKAELVHHSREIKAGTEIASPVTSSGRIIVLAGCLLPACLFASLLSASFLLSFTVQDSLHRGWSRSFHIS